MLSSVSHQLRQRQGMIIDVQTLFESLTVQASLTGGIISIKANGTEPQLLKLILDTL